MLAHGIGDVERLVWSGTYGNQRPPLTHGLDDTLRSALDMTDHCGRGISTRVAHGGDHKVVTSRSGWSPRAMSPRSPMVIIHRVTAPESEQTALATSPTRPSPATKGRLACPNRRPAVQDL
ncbi:hypothetical protein [Nocardia xishanensis]|uniref:hypothetical protein n=1 Tax=Nocardia xishanensis TaxID=238964 RepID=UPI0033C4B34E